MIVFMKTTIKVFEKTNDIVGYVVKYLLLLMAVCICIEVTGRYLLNSPTIWVYDVSRQLLGFMGALGGGYAFLYNAHVRVDVFYQKLSLKGRAILDIITSAVFFLFISVLLVQSINAAQLSWAIGERATTLLAPPLYYMKAAVAVGAFLVLIQGIAKLFRDILIVVTGEDHTGKGMNYH